MLPMSAKLTKRHLKKSFRDQNVIKRLLFSDGTILDKSKYQKLKIKWEK
jgi:hypothetical protein